MATSKKIELELNFQANGKEILGKLAIDSKQLAGTIASVNKRAKDFQKQMSDWGFMAQGLDQAVGVVKGLENAIGDVTVKYESFDKSMRAANTMAGKSGKEFDNLKESVKGLSKEVPVARDVLANGLYRVISNGVPEDNWMEFLEKSARSSVGGIADLGQTVTVTSTILKNYALDWEKAGEIQDKIQLTAKNGETSFEQLAAALPRVSGNASTLGVSVDELMASFATLTGVSGNTAEVSTQLAAVFTALLKPSKEASTLAAEMGIQFDAAAIKAAGGFSNFLTKLKESVAAYASASGELEQSVMAKLFGSAESLRALGPLMGNLSAKFNENVAAMANSAGTMDAAFSEMAGSADSQKQVWENMYASIMDNVGAVAQWTKQGLYWLGMIGEAGVGTTKLITLIRSFNIVTTASVMKTRILALGISTYGIMSGKTAKTQRILNQAMAEGAISGQALKVAIRGLMMASGVGAVMMALGYAVSFFMDKADEATESTNNFTSAQEAFKHKSTEVKAEMMQEASALKKLMDSHSDTRIEVEKLESKYGDIFGKHKTAAEWYDILTTKSTKYAQALGYLAQMEQLHTEMAAAAIEKEQNDNKIKEIKDKEGETIYHAPETVLSSTGMPAFRPGFTSKNPKLVPLEKATEGTKKRIDDIQEKIDIATKKAEALMNEVGATPIMATPNAAVAANSKGGIKKEKNKPDAPAGSLAEVTKQISDTEAKIKVAVDMGSRAALQKELDLLTEKKRSIEISYKFPDFKKSDYPAVTTLPTKIDTIFPVKLDSMSPEIKAATDRLLELAKAGDITKEKIADAMQSIGSSISGLGNALELPELNVAGTMAQAIATLVQGFATASSQSNSMGPFGWLAFTAAGLAQLTAVVASVKQLPKFADGGLAFGPTLGIFGEYAGASNNPEVVAPLDKLRSLISTPDTSGGKVEFVIEGRNLKGVLNKANRLSSRS